jgi:hypothetical protein
MSCPSTVSYICQIFKKLVYKLFELFAKVDFCEDQLIASCTLLKGVNEFLTVICVFLDHFGLNLGYEILMYCYSASHLQSLTLLHFSVIQYI